MSLNAKEVTRAVESLTTVTGNFNSKLQATSGPISIGQVILSAYKDIVTEQTKDIAIFGLGGGNDSSGSSPFTDEEQAAIAQAIIAYADVSMAALRTVIGEKGVLSSTPFTAPIAAVMRTHEGATDTIAFGLVGLLPKAADEVKPKVQELDQTLQQCISTYTVTMPGMPF